MHDKMPSFLPKKKALTNQIHLNNEQKACVIY